VPLDHRTIVDGECGPENLTLMICCSGSCGPRLVLDL
jgi:hypothetical protein